MAAVRPAGPDPTIRSLVSCGPPTGSNAGVPNAGARASPNVMGAAIAIGTAPMSLLKSMLRPPKDAVSVGDWGASSWLGATASALGWVPLRELRSFTAHIVALGRYPR